MSPMPTDGRPTSLQSCRACGEPFVVPQALLDVVGVDRYVVELRCTSCCWSGIEVHDDRAMEALDRALDRSSALMQLSLEAIEVARELERIDRFGAALRADLILPEDF